MTAATLPYPEFPVVDALDRSLGPEAQSLRRIQGGDAIASWSTLDERRVQIDHSLHRAYLESGNTNWDAEGSSAADPMSLSYTRALLHALPSWIPSPDVSVDPDGEFNAEWYYDRRAVFTMSVGRDGTISYAGLFGMRKMHGIDIFTGEVPAAITEGVRKARQAGGLPV